MSQWTHVAATIRIDSIFRNGVCNKIQDALGETLNWKDEIDSDTYYMPYGSEGSLEYVITEHPDESSIAAFTVTIYGDLRDYDDADAIIKWFEEVCNKFCIRQAVITIDVEYQKTVYGSFIGESELNRNIFGYNEILRQFLTKSKRRLRNDKFKVNTRDKKLGEDYYTGSELLKMMDYYNVTNLRDISEEQAQAYYEMLLDNTTER